MCIRDSDGIQYLKADIGEDANYDAYLGIVPGEFLAKIYCKYGSTLLQGNIRAFLSVRGKVNKGIRETLSLIHISCGMQLKQTLMQQPHIKGILRMQPYSAKI